MNGNNEILNKAVDIINQRRTRAKALNDMHFEEVNEKIPEIREINSQLSGIGAEIFGAIRSGGNISEKLNDMREKKYPSSEYGKKMLVQHGYPEDYLTIKYTCEKCFDTGFSDGKRCECFKNLTARLTAEKMNSLSQVNLCSFDTFRLDYYRGRNVEETAVYRKTMGNIYRHCREYAENFSLSSENILMFGRTGLGKTHLSLSIAGEVLKKGFNVLYDSSVNYLRMIEKENFGRSDGSVDTLENLLSAHLLILDDMGSEFDTPFYISVIYNIINTRMNRGLPTIISTNLNHEGIQEKYNERIVSRLFAAYNCLEFVGTDIRLIKRKNGEL